MLLGMGGRCPSRAVWPEEGVCPLVPPAESSLSPSEWCCQWGMGWALGVDLWAELQRPHLRNGVASLLGNELGWAAQLRKAASW